MRIVLSRKGFDSAAGGGPSPVLKDGTMLSLPIPEIPGMENAPRKLKNWHKYDELNLPKKIKDCCREQSEYCHLDPDIRPTLSRKKRIFQPAFGQCGAAGGHLHNQIDIGKINRGDDGILFLFFGLFRCWKNENFTGKPFHAIWGYMVCNEVITNAETMKARSPYHPHANLPKAKNNLLFIAKEDCYGTFKYCERLVLTASGHSPSHWKLDCLPWLDIETSQANMTYHDDRKRFKQEYFQSTCRGQEFVVSPGVENHPELNWKNCSFCQILSNLEKMYPEK